MDTILLPSVLPGKLNLAHSEASQATENSKVVILGVGEETQKERPATAEVPSPAPNKDRLHPPQDCNSEHPQTGIGERR